MKYFYITGTSRGIGKAIAELLSNRPDSLVIGLSRNSSIIHPGYTHETMDLSDLKAVSKFSFRSHKDAELIVLFNNAASLEEVKHLGNISNDDLIKDYSINLAAPAVLMNSFIKAYQSLKCNRVIVNITSGAAQAPYDGWAAYCSSKAGLDMLSRVAATEQALKENPIKVMAIAPGVVDTAMQTRLRTTDESDFSRKQKFIDLHREQKLYAPSDVAKELIRIVENPEMISEVVHRISL